MARSPAVVEQDIDVENSGNAVSLDIGGRTELFININGETGNEYQVDVRRTGGSWIQNVGSSFTGSANYTTESRTVAAQEVRLRCSSGSGGSGDTATITLMASG
jgi:hypothetical protein